MKSNRSSRPIWLGEDQRGWDHVRVHIALLKDKRLGANEIGVYVGLVAHAELQTGECHPSAQTLARYINVSDDTVRRSIRILVDSGYIRLERDEGRANRYYLLPPPTLTESLHSYPHPTQMEGGSEPDPTHTAEGTLRTQRRVDLIYKQEPYNEIKELNKKSYPQGEQNPRGYRMVNSVPCDACEAGWVLNDDNTAEVCTKCNAERTDGTQALETIRKELES